MALDILDILLREFQAAVLKIRYEPPPTFIRPASFFEETGRGKKGAAALRPPPFLLM
jgi:hypothetical protein